MEQKEIHIFDHALLKKRKERASRNIDSYDFLFQKVHSKLTDRLYDFQRTFDNALVIGNSFFPLLPQEKIKKQKNIDILSLEHEVLPFEENSFDIVFSNLCLHWINDIPGFLIQIKKILKPDGVFIASLFGGDTLTELRLSLMNTEIQTLGGASPRVSPFIDIKDAGALLQRAGFNLPVVDKEKCTVTYTSPLKLLHDLRGMGETNALSRQNKKPLPKNFFPTLCMNYERNFSLEDRRVPASFDILFFSGWKYHENQQKPLRPGEGKVHLGEVLTQKKS